MFFNQDGILNIDEAVAENPSFKKIMVASIAEGSMGKAVQMIHDDSWREERALVRDAFLNVKSVQDIPACSQLLKNKKGQRRQSGAAPCGFPDRG